MTFRRIQREPQRGPMNVLYTFLVRLLGVALLGALLYFGWRYIAVDRLDEEIRQRVEAKFREHYQGLVVSVESARRIDGEGVEIRGLSIREVDRPNEPPLLFVDQIFASC